MARTHRQCCIEISPHERPRSLSFSGAANDPLLSGKPWAVGPFESICENDVCAEASTALYISEQGTSQPDVLKGALEAALGWAGQLRYPNGHPASEDGTQKDGTRP